MLPLKRSSKAATSLILPFRRLLVGALLGTLVSCQTGSPEPERTPALARPAAPLLQRNPVNPRYFCDATGRAVFLTGSHTWNNLQDKGNAPRFDWDHYLDFLTSQNHNLIRLWAIQTIPTVESKGASGALPLPWLRTGPGVAIDGKPRFDLQSFNPAYFDRLRDRVLTAAAKGIYVDVMFFEAFCATVGNSKAIDHHAFAAGNNINGVDILANPRAKVYAGWISLDQPEVVRLQEAYIRKVIETLNAFDNVIYEIANEPTGLSHPWQEHLITFVHELEATLPKQHLIGSPGGMKTLNHAMFASSADWVSPDIHAPDDPAARGYLEGTMTWGEPDYDHGDKVVILDTDHLWGLGGNVDWAWKSFCRGYNLIYMDPGTDWPGAFFTGYGKWSNVPNRDLRREMGIIRAFADRIDLNHTLPRNELSSTGYLLAEPGNTYLCYQPAKGRFTVSAESGIYEAEWHFPQTGESSEAGAMALTSNPTTFTAPKPEPAVLLLHRSIR